MHWTSKYVFDLKPETDVFWCTADAGWVTGHSYSVYGPLMNGVTSVMYEGPPDYPHRAIWWELVERYRVSVLYTAPTIIRSFMSWGAELPAAYDCPRCACSAPWASRSTPRRGSGIER